MSSLPSLSAELNPQSRWEFWIDVGGTFTDCIARSPDDELHDCKVLSSGMTKGRFDEVVDRFHLIAHDRRNDAPRFWNSYDVRFFDDAGTQIHSSRIDHFEAETGGFQLTEPLKDTLAELIRSSGIAYELSGGEESPIGAIRRILKLPLDQPIPPVSVKLGTTRGTNALLTRTGANTAFVTTRGFRDVLLIGNQNRPRLFDLVIQKPQPLFTEVVEIDERLDADGNVLTAVDEAEVRRQLEALRKTNVESVAICLLHSFANPTHEEIVERLARGTGFTEISTSSSLSPLIKIVSRGDTTCVDAYLNPVLREYVQRLRDSLNKEATGSSEDEAAHSTPDQITILKLMTSAGGLVDADRFVGKDSVLSGPAGGVIGFSRVAQQAGFEKSIGFDMGGTSTDVARFDGTYEREFETEKAGVRVVAPMLAIETVAAGGGSICGFDGVKMHVGPQSAGAHPGPACYGSGGPLTVTDVNLFLGKILPSRFPFPLDHNIVEQRLQVLCDEIAASPLGVKYHPAELAEGFVNIANANMVRAVRRISVAKGYDPTDYVLVTFGGAGAQHACAIAKLLGMRQILVHPYSGILSAYGIGMADVRRFREKSVLKTYSPDTLVEAESVFGELETLARDDVMAEGISNDRIQPAACSLDMRYLGVDSTINVTRPADGDFSRRYEELHEQLYGYRHAKRPIEVTAARVEVTGRMPNPPETSRPIRQRVPQPSEMTETVFDGVPQPTGVFLRSDLQAGDEILGPAMICEPTSTVIVDPGFEATIAERGEILISEEAREIDEQATPDDSSLERRGRIGNQPAKPDPVLLEIFNNLFASIAEQMGVTLQRTSFSTNVKERLDFSCAIFSPNGDLVVNAPHIPVHLGAMSETVKRILQDNPQMGPGDVFVTNDPYRGGSHLPDVTVITPVFDQNVDAVDSQLLFFTASRAHHAEIGGIVPGSMPPFSKNLGEEGILIRNFKLVDRGHSREAELRELLLSGRFPTRNVHDNLADVAAQVAANNTGVKLLNELIERYTLSVVQAYMVHIQRAAAEKMRLALHEIPDGVYCREDALDCGAKITVEITIDGQQATVDFTGTAPVLSTNLNANSAIVNAAVLYVFRCLIQEDIPLNSGVLEPVEIILPECLLNPAEHEDPAQCAAVVGGNVETSQRVVDTLLGALGKAAASQGTMNNLTFGDDTFGYYETICGGSGATPAADGTDAVHTHMTNTRLTDAEVIERRYPVRVHEFLIRHSSGGSGQHRGGDGIIRKLEFLAPLKVSMLSERRGEYAPFGLSGGEPGKIGRNSVLRAGELETENLGGKFAIEVQPGDKLIVETPGGGGCGITSTQPVGKPPSALS